MTNYFKLFLKNIKQFDPFEENWLSRSVTVDNIKYQIHNSKVPAGAIAAVCIGKSSEFPGQIFLLKKLKRETAQDLNDFFNEIAILRKLNHPNIVSYHASDIKQRLLIMEYLFLGDLVEIMIANPGGFHELLCLKIIWDVSEGLSYLHRKGFFHRDIKPDNIMVDRYGDCQIGDFGAAIELRSGKATEKYGSPKYMAPEVKKELPYDSAADIWSLGILIFVLIVGQFPSYYPDSARIILDESLNEIPDKKSGSSDANPSDDSRRFIERKPKISSILWHCVREEPKMRYSADQVRKRAKEEFFSEKAIFDAERLSRSRLF
jgi:serine/threonine protein kinase